MVKLEDFWILGKGLIGFFRFFIVKWFCLWVFVVKVIFIFVFVGLYLINVVFFIVNIFGLFVCMYLFVLIRLFGCNFKVFFN